MFDFITDRTQYDVDRVNELSAKGWDNMTAEEQAEWSAGLKGAYNHTDFNRVEMAVAYLSEKFGLGLTTKTNWTDWDIPKQSDIDRFMGNIAAVRAVASVYTATPRTPTSMSRLTYTIANDIEKILLDIITIEPSLFRFGELYCGEV